MNYFRRLRASLMCLCNVRFIVPSPRFWTIQAARYSTTDLTLISLPQRNFFPEWLSRIRMSLPISSYILCFSGLQTKSKASSLRASKQHLWIESRKLSCFETSSRRSQVAGGWFEKRQKVIEGQLERARTLSWGVGEKSCEGMVILSC